EKVVAELSDYLQRNLAAMVWLTRIKDGDDYTAKHSINSAILAMGLAHALEWPQEQVGMVGLAALLHDVGNVAVERSILEKPAPLNEAEFEQVQNHPHVGYALLNEEPGVPEAVAKVALNHHERLDGSGYPQGLEGEGIDPISRLVAIVDVYDALTSDRPYRPARSHHDALGSLWRGRGQLFDPEMLETFVDFMGWVVPGTLVRLSDGALAIVEEVNIGRSASPIVRRLVSGALGYEAGRRLDLAEQGDVPGDQRVRIAEVLPDGAHGIKVKSLLVAALSDEDHE
ncbi:MAG: HD-GYP domain-containing protein, partial [Pseudomonadota bacterium]